MRRRLKLGLLGKFALASAIPLLVMGVVLGKYLSHRIEQRTLAQAERSAELIARVGFQPQISKRDLDRGHLPAARRRALDKALKSKELEDGLARIKIWNRQVRVVYSDKTALIGQQFHIFGPLRAALSGRTTSTVSSVTRADNASERQFGKVLEVYVPLVLARGEDPAGAMNFYLPYEPIAREIRHETRTMYLLLLAGMALLYAALFRIVVGASRRLRQQARDLTRHAAEKEYQSLHDPLTGLPNRSLFADRIEEALESAGADEREVAVLLMDLDRFKEINDTLGHHSGDQLLQELGGRLRAALRGSDTVARLGGDEFGILLPVLPERRIINEVVERIRAAVEEPFVLQGLPLAIETSIGVAIFPAHGMDVETLLQRADVAMYLAKSGNSLYEVYDEEHDEYDPSRLTLVGELRHAIDEGELTVYYQPKAVLDNGEVEGVEALIRWEHPERGLLSPDQFIPLAEHTGLIGPLTFHVLNEALRQCREWRDEGLHLTVAVNLAMRNLLDLGFPSRVAELLDKWRLAPGTLELEITENTIMADPFRAMTVLRRLNEMGVKLSIDDFGTGYSSLAYLKSLPVDAVKIDKSFVMGMANDDNNDGAIVRSTIDLARNLGLNVVAEGVETGPIWTELRDLGCNLAQGYLLSRPLPAAELTRWLRDRATAAAPEGVAEAAPAVAAANGNGERPGLLSGGVAPRLAEVAVD
ncbi:MAG: putative bifunctional diguanylate cyclase/phosphodiesterase [Gaiellaceae bacterium]